DIGNAVSEGRAYNGNVKSSIIGLYHRKAGVCTHRKFVAAFLGRKVALHLDLIARKATQGLVIEAGPWIWTQLAHHRLAMISPFDPHPKAEDMTAPAIKTAHHKITLDHRAPSRHVNAQQPSGDLAQALAVKPRSRHRQGRCRSVNALA